MMDSARGGPFMFTLMLFRGRDPGTGNANAVNGIDIGRHLTSTLAADWPAAEKVSMALMDILSEVEEEKGKRQVMQ